MDIIFPSDVIGIIAQYCDIDEISNLLLTTNQQYKIITSELLELLSNIYNYPYVKSLGQLINFKKYDHAMLCHYACKTDDIRVYKYHYNLIPVSNYYDLYYYPKNEILEKLSEYGNISYFEYPKGEISYNIKLRDSWFRYYELYLGIPVKYGSIKIIDFLIENNNGRAIDIHTYLISAINKNQPYLVKYLIIKILSHGKNLINIQQECDLLEKMIKDINNWEVLAEIIDLLLDNNCRISKRTILMAIDTNKFNILSKLLSHQKCYINNSKRILRKVFRNNYYDILDLLLANNHYKFEDIIQCNYDNNNDNNNYSI